MDNGVQSPLVLKVADQALTICPTHVLTPHRFATGKGVQSLMNVLKAYAATDAEVGYCQVRLMATQTGLHRATRKGIEYPKT